MRILLAAGLLLGLAMNAQAAERMKPGQWEMIMYSDMGGAKVQMPKMTPEQMKQMEQAGVKMPPMTPDGGMIVKTCVTKEQVERDEMPKPPESARQKCEQTDVKRVGKTTHWKMACTSDGNTMNGSGEMTLLSPEAYSAKSSFTGKGPRGDMAFGSTVQGKWLSPNCETPTPTMPKPK